MVVLISPPTNFKNNTFTSKQIAETLLEKDIDRINPLIQKLVLSILASANKETLEHFLSKDFTKDLIELIKSSSDGLSHEVPKADQK